MRIIREKRIEVWEEIYLITDLVVMPWSALTAHATSGPWERYSVGNSESAGLVEAKNLEKLEVGCIYLEMADRLIEVNF